MPAGGCRSMEQAKKIAKSVKEYLREHPRTMSIKSRLKISNTMHGIKHSQIHIERILESRIGGFWYGNIKYYEFKSNGKFKKRYCELWTEDLKERIRAYWNYTSPLSGKTAKENRGRNLCCHHVYYQEKACCEWDEDVQGYFAMINIGTFKNPIMYKYPIKGDPNKFVPLTTSEHMQSNFNRLEWIKLFEDIIDEQGGKCYFSKREIEELTFDFNKNVNLPMPVKYQDCRKEEDDGDYECKWRYHPDSCTCYGSGKVDA